MNQSDTRAVEIDLRDLGKDGFNVVRREISLFGALKYKTFPNFERNMSILESLSPDPITIKLCCPGGAIDEGFAIIDRIRESDCTIQIKAYGLIASMGILILASGDVRYAGENVEFMHHSGSISNIHGRAIEIKRAQKIISDADSNCAKFLASRTKQSYSFWMSYGKDKDEYFDVKKALEYGLIDDRISSLRTPVEIPGEEEYNNAI